MKQQVKKITVIENAINELDGHTFTCHLCPRNCQVNRHKREKGFCGGGALPKIYRYDVHQGEEPAISGSKGSGTVFFSRCSLECVYCQNHIWSQGDAGDEIEIPALAMTKVPIKPISAYGSGRGKEKEWSARGFIFTVGTGN